MADYSREEIQDLISTNVKVVLKGKDLSKLNLKKLIFVVQNAKTQIFQIAI